MFSWKRTKSYKGIAAILAAHFSSKPMVIAKRFGFQKRNQEEGESVTMILPAVKKK